MNRCIACFCLGTLCGILGTMLYGRLRELEGPEEIDELANRLADNVAELESRLELIIADTLSE